MSVPFSCTGRGKLLPPPCGLLSACLRTAGQFTLRGVLRFSLDVRRLARTVHATSRLPGRLHVLDV